MRIAYLLVTLGLLLPLTTQAYIGPGAGLSALGALWALVLALFTAVFFILAWPVRRALRRRRAAQAGAEDDAGEGMESTARTLDDNK